MKKMKKALALSLALVMSATLFGCAPKENPAANSPTASDPAASTQSSQSGEERQDHDEIVIKLGASSASTEPTGIAGQKFADLVNERLAGRVRRAAGCCNGRGREYAGGFAAGRHFLL